MKTLIKTFVPAVLLAGLAAGSANAALINYSANLTPVNG